MWNAREIEQLAYRLPSRVPSSPSRLPRRLRLYHDDLLSIYYAPLGFINRKAKLAIIGLTPGWRQAEIAYRAAIEAISGGADPLKAHRQRKSKVAFAGSMRRNLIAMLDELGVHSHLGVESTEVLFGGPLLHTGSALRYPVFKNGENYSGHGPLPTKHAALRGMLEEVLAPELNSLSDALVVPLGKAVSVSLEYLSTAGLLPEQRWLRGFPHPSGANGTRKADFNSSKRNLRAQVNSWFTAHPVARKMR
jgi:hypothetical protein